MALQEYNRKRSFERTPEPRGAPGTRRGKQALSFVVQLHHARRRHYDFRLEFDGVLHSWAVPKGPSFRTDDKRLAVEVEPHPLSYGGFEGEIPKGNYGAGHVAMYDRGTWTPEVDPREGLKDGKLYFSLHGERLRGRWRLVRTHGKGVKPQWLLMKLDDEYAGDLEADDLLEGVTPPHGTPAAVAAAAKPARRASTRAAGKPEWRPPMLATASRHPPEGDDWLHEWKWDGYRVTSTTVGANVAVYTRSGLDWSGKLPHLVEAIRALDRDLQLDGELVALDERGYSDFNALQHALMAGKTAQLRYLVFDLPGCDGEDLASLPLLERKQRLHAIVGDGGRQKGRGALVYSEHIEGHGPEVFKAARQHGVEGIVSKRAGSRYAPGRSRDWLKIKALDTREFVIAGYTDPKGSRTGIGALLLAKRDTDGAGRAKLVYAGRVGSGLDDETLRSLHRQLKAIARDKPTVEVPAHTRIMGKVHWVDPVLVAEVIFRGWGKEGLLRQASFHRVREDRVVDATLSQPAALPALTSPGRVVYPPVKGGAAKVTKQDVFDYYTAAAPRLLEDMGGHLLSIVRCPDGIGGQHFFQKHLGKGFGEAIHQQEIRENDGDVRKYFFVDDLAGLLSLVQMNALEFHPWGSRADQLETPDRIIFDLDPDPSIDWKTVKAAAREVRDRLADVGLESFPRLTGGKGVHVVVPLAPVHEWPDARGFCEAFANAMATQSPDRYVATMSKAKRQGRIFIDWLRNGRGATAIASWSLRARPGAPVAMPVTWEELGRARTADKFNLRNALERLGAAPWEDAAARGQRLPV